MPNKIICSASFQETENGEVIGEKVFLRAAGLAKKAQGNQSCAKELLGKTADLDIKQVVDFLSKIPSVSVTPVGDRGGWYTVFVRTQDIRKLYNKGTLQDWVLEITGRINLSLLSLPAAKSEDGGKNPRNRRSSSLPGR